MDVEQNVYLVSAHVLAGAEIPGGGGRWGEVEGGGGREVGGGELYLTLHWQHQNDFCIQMGSDVSHFNTELTVRGSHKPQSHTRAATAPCRTTDRRH